MSNKLQSIIDKHPILFNNQEMSSYYCEDGWVPLIEKLSEDIEEIVVKNNLQDKFEVTCLKEKFGGLRYYVNLYFKEIQDLINEAESKSYNICEFCGEPGKIRSGRWLKVRCDDCENKKQLLSI